MTTTTDYGIVDMSWEETTEYRQNHRGYWIVPEMVSSTSTLLYGESESGKSFIAAHLAAALATGGEFLWRPIVGGPYRVGIAHTDDDGNIEYQDRVMSATGSGDNPGVHFFRVPLMQTDAHWEDLLRRCRTNRIEFLILDNMTQAASGDINKTEAITRFFDGVRRIIAAGIPVVVVSHSSDKNFGNGKSKLPAGGYAIRAAVRWRVFVERSAGDRVKLTFSGNHARTHDMTVIHGDGTHFTLADSHSADERAESERKREKATQDEYREIAAFIVAECQGMGVNQVADACVARFGKSKTTYKNHLSPGGKPTANGKGLTKPGRLCALLDRTGEGTGATWRWKEPV